MCKLKKSGVNFPKGVKFNADGSRLLVASEDHMLRVFSTDSATAGDASDDAVPPSLPLPCTVCVSAGEAVYDCAWYPFATPSNAASNCFISTARDHPVQLWDAASGRLRASYRAFDHMDEIAAALSVCFNPSGERILAGFNRMLRVFDVSRPGRPVEEHATSKTRASRVGQRGLLSCIAFNTDGSGMYAVGSYNNSTALYQDDQRKDRRPIAELECPADGLGVTQVQFSPNSNYLFTGHRMSDAIHCWDVRSTREEVLALPRDARTNQRLQFDIEPFGRFLIAGSRDNRALVYDLTTGTEAATVPGLPDACNGVSVSPGGGSFALATGQRHFHVDDGDDDGDDDDDHVGGGTISVWKTAPPSATQ